MHISRFSYSMVTAFLMYIFCLNAQSQSNEPKKYKIRSVLVINQFTKKDGTHEFASGGGFILNNKYLATCYHIYKPIQEPISINNIYVYYNFKPRITGLVYDTMTVNLDYKPSRTQYNFRNHVYDTNDVKTDFIILKLKNEITGYPFKEDWNQHFFYEDLTMVGCTAESTDSVVTDLKLTIGEVKLLNTRIDPHDSSFFEIAVVGTGGHGFSGSPVVDVNGNFIGMLHRGFMGDNKERLKGVLLYNGYSKANFSKVMENFKEGDLIGRVIPIQYLVKRYMKGYLK